MGFLNKLLGGNSGSKMLSKNNTITIDESLGNVLLAGNSRNGMYMLYRENDNLTASDLIDYFLVPVSKSYIHFCEDMLKVWRGDISTTNENMDMYFLYMFEKTNAFRNELRDTIEEYLVRIGKGKRNALFEELEDYFADNADLSYSKRLDKYIKDFNKNHVSFWDKIKNIFSVKEEGEHNGKKK